MSSNWFCNHTRDKTNQTPATRSDFVNHSYDYRPNWTPITIINRTVCNWTVARIIKHTLVVLESFIFFQSY